MKNFYKVFPYKKTIIGMIHLPPLLGYPAHPGMKKVIEKALYDLYELEKGGVHGVMVENEYDQPHKVVVPAETIAAITKVTDEVIKHAKKTVVGVELLLNDPKASFAVAQATGAKFIRTDYFVDRMSRPEYGGEMHIDPVGLLKYRKSIGAENVLLLTDIQVKYAQLLEKKSIATSAKQAKNHDADAIIVSGTETGKEPIVKEITEAKKAVGNFPVLIGSGITDQNASQLLSECDGAIVGTFLKTVDKADSKRASSLMKKVKALN